MSVLDSIGLWIGAIIIVLGIIVYGTYNGLISKRNRVQDALAQIDVQLKRRYDLIPNLVETVKGYMKYEKSTLTQITQLRSSIVTGSVQDKAACEQPAQRSTEEHLRGSGELSGPEGI